MSEVRAHTLVLLPFWLSDYTHCSASFTECIVYTWDYHSSTSIWNSLRVLPILSDEIMTFKALILVHKVLQEGHKCALKEGQNQIGWLETCSRTLGSEGARGRCKPSRS
jgi:hypothetical protein